MSTTAKITIQQYDEMIRAGIFAGFERQRVELIYGEVSEMNPIGPTHEYCVDLLNRWSFENAPLDQVIVRVQNLIGLPGLDSVPEPDVVWVANKSYRKRRPQAEDVLLVIEVADSSLVLDRGKKAELYAAAGIEDYWIVNVLDNCVEVLREPSAGKYGSQQAVAADGTLQPLAFPDVVLSLVELFS